MLIHGIGSRWQVWKPVLDALAERHEVIAPDLPGFGGTRWDGVPGSVPHLADRVEAFLDSAAITHPVLGGSSLGGGVALELARRGRARSVVAFSPVGFAGPAGAVWSRAVVGSARTGGAAVKPLLPRLLATRAGRVALCGVFFGHPGALPPAECLADAHALLAAPGFPAARRHLGRWRLPTPVPDVPITIAWGTRDLVLPYVQAARARTLLPGARHVRLPGCGHLPFADDPQTCIRLLLEARPAGAAGS
ncbi:alpha/beta fold hydrolase [Paractinoplanes ferrugineus]|uniref:Hydrolase n=1 Tax=Paractinoplanes ferrugineus TaxID=113564 RepID=A0A919J7H2_9ACTN|nr:hydrolase [Actinoplanes ferrugineus]